MGSSDKTSEFLAPKILRVRFGKINAMKNFLCVNKTLPTLEKSFKVAAKLRRELRTDRDGKNTTYGTFIFS